MQSLLDLELIYLHDTAKAVLVAIDEMAEGVWLPKSLIEIHECQNIRGSVMEITIPEHLAMDKGLI